jgi:hypothetical protein
MPFIFKRLALVLSIATAFAADKEVPFRPAPIESFAHKQTNAQITVAADPYNSGDKVKAAFGKLDPYEWGVLPVLVVIQNDSSQSIRLDRLKVEYNGPGGNKVGATPAREVRFAKGPDRPNMIPGPTGGIKIGKGKKNPLAAWEIEGRAFSAQMLPPGQSAFGFFYFQTPIQTGSTLYLSGMEEARSGKELFYFEVPLQ